MSEPEGPGLEETGRLIDLLADFSARAAARRRLLQIGRRAVGPLMEALGSPIEGVAWCAAVTLGEIGAEEAIGPLEQALSRTALREAALEALRRITGRDYSQTVPAGGAATRAVSTGVRHMGDAEIAAALSSETVTCRQEKTGCTFNVLLPGGRHQEVRMMLGLADSDGSPLVAFYTECGPADPDRYERALKANLKTPFGAFAIRESGGSNRFVMVDAYLRDSVTVHQLKRSLEFLARRADSMEKELTGKDSH